MNARRAVALALLLTFPASSFAQTPSTPLDLSSIKHVVSEPERRPFTLSFSGGRPEFQQGPPMQSCVESEARGRTDADRKGINKGWFWGGVGIGAAIGPWGWGGAPLGATFHKPKPKSVPAGLDRDCYTSGFGNKGRHENVHSALWGSMVGSVAWFLWFFAAIE